MIENYFSIQDTIFLMGMMIIISFAIIKLYQFKKFKGT